MVQYGTSAPVKGNKEQKEKNTDAGKKAKGTKNTEEKSNG